MSCIENASVKNMDWIPRELGVAALGIAISSISNVALEIFTLKSAPWNKLPSLAKYVFSYGSIASSIVGAVLTVHAIILLCKKNIGEKTDLQMTATAMTIGTLVTGLAAALSKSLSQIAPSLRDLERYSIVYSIGTNLALHAAFITGIGAALFTVYAAYRTGQELLATLVPVLGETKIK